MPHPTPSPVGRIGPYRTVQLSKVIDPATERRRCVLRRKPVDVNGVVDYHTEADIFLITYLPLPIKGLDSSPVNILALEGVPGFSA